MSWPKKFYQRHRLRFSALFFEELRKLAGPGPWLEPRDETRLSINQIKEAYRRAALEHEKEAFK